MIYDLLKTAILNNLGVLKPAPNNWLKCNCKLCSMRGQGLDIRSRFGILFSSTSMLLHCFNCGFSASWEEGNSISRQFKFFLENIGIEEKFIKEIEFELYKIQNNIKILKDGDEEIVDEDKEARIKSLFQKWKTTELPKDSLPITYWLNAGLDDQDFLQVVNYAINRKIFNLDEFYWSPVKLFNMNKRLIIPYYYKDEIVGYTTRLSFDLKDKSIPKYYQQCPTDFVFNLDKQRSYKRKHVILNEGVLDAWMTDGIASLGEINQSKIDIINRLHKDIIVCPDRDKKGKDLVNAAISNNWAVSFPKWDMGVKDAAQATEKYGKLLTVHSIIESAVKGKEQIELNWRIAQNAREKRRQY